MAVVKLSMSCGCWQWNESLWLLSSSLCPVAVVNVMNHCGCRQALLNQLELSLASIVTLFHGKTAQGAPLLPQHAIERRKTSLHVHDAVPPAPMLTRLLTLCCCAHSVLLCCCAHSTVLLCTLLLLCALYSVFGAAAFALSLAVLYPLAALHSLDCLFAESSSTFWQHSRDARVACCHAHHSREARPQQPKCQNLSSQSRPNLAGVHLLPSSNTAVTETPHRALSQSSFSAASLCGGLEHIFWYIPKYP